MSIPRPTLLCLLLQLLCDHSVLFLLLSSPAAPTLLYLSRSTRLLHSGLFIVVISAPTTASLFRSCSDCCMRYGGVYFALSQMDVAHAL